MAYYDFLNIIFAPLFKISILWAVIILSFIISLIITVITKYMTDQNLMKKLKEEMKENQKLTKELRGNPARLMEVQKKQMELTMQQFKHSFKPTLITFIPIFFIFGWMSSNFAYESIKPQQEFSITAFFAKNTNGGVELIVHEGVIVVDDKVKKIQNDKASWTLKGDEGEHTVEVVYNNEKQQKDILITNNDKYVESSKKTNGAINQIQIDYKPKKILKLFGWKLGWLGTYIIFSLAFTMILRKVMKVY